ncbi:response regulator [Neorhizobium sp. NPDC001467]|uniref:response regulator n=1 Tax=Neorhizobium sp. NPDC001467 TaxID=3390595 RepID=UPI003D00BAAA
MGQSQAFGRPVVLVVEDEPLLRMMAIDLVEDAGLEAIEAANGDEALRLLECRSDIRVVFTDIDMPGSMDGLDLAAAVRDRWPPIEIILTSGHIHVSEIDLPQRGAFFSKPYDHGQVMRALQSMTGEGDDRL